MSQPIDKNVKKFGELWGLILWAVIFQVLLFAYVPAMSGPFVYDDVYGIVDNADLRHPEAPWRLFASHDSSLEFDRRPVTGVSMLVNFQLVGLNPSGYRVINLLLHFLTGLVLAGVVYRVAVYFKFQGACWLSLGVAMLWLFHPLNTSAVSYIYQRSEILMSLFYLLAIFCLLKAGKDGARKWLYLSSICAVFSVLSKEIGLTLIASLPVVDRLVHYRSIKDLFHHKKIYYSLLLLVFLILTAWISTGVRMGELDDGVALTTSGEYLTYQFRVLFRYITLVFWPHPLIFNASSKPMEGVGNWLPYLIMLVAIFGSIFVAGVKRRWLWLLLGMFLFILAPTSSIVPIPLEPEAEFRMYLPSALVLVVALTLIGSWLIKSQYGRYVGVVLYFVILVSCVVATRARNHVFADSENLWLSVVKHDPGNAKAWMDLGLIAITKEEYTKADRCVYNLRVLAEQRGNEGLYNTARHLHALIQLESGNPDNALVILRELQSEGVSIISLNLDLALSYGRLGQFDTAWKHLRQSEKDLSPHNMAVLSASVELYIASGRTDQAKSILEHLESVSRGTPRVVQLRKMYDQSP